MGTTVRKTAAWLLSIMMISSAFLHAYWALGGTWFLATALGKSQEYVENLPMDIIILTWVFVVCMFFATYLALARVGVLPRFAPQWLYATGLWGFMVLMLGGAALNFGINDFWDRFVFGPIFLLLAILGLVLAWPLRQKE